MKTTDLMIGDWVYVNPISHRVEPHDSRVLSIRKEYENGYIYIEGNYTDKVYEKREFEPNWFGWSVSPSDLSPIPLTPELLKKNGFTDCESDFERNIYHYYLGERCVITNSNLHIGSDGMDYWIDTFNVHVRPLRYVHELQHALRLSGLDELANNFKV